MFDESLLQEKSWKKIRNTLTQKQDVAMVYYLDCDPLLWAEFTRLDKRRAKNKNSVGFITGCGKFAGLENIENGRSFYVMLDEPICYDDLVLLKSARTAENYILLVTSSNYIVRFIINNEEKPQF